MDIISALNSFITEIFTAAANFIEDPRGMVELEERITAASHNTNARILEQILTEYDEFLRNLPDVKRQYVIQRRRERTLITTFGDVTFKRTLYKTIEDGSYHFLLDEIGGQTISKVAVMNKVHGIEEELPIKESAVKKVCKYLYIEADEDHIHRQKSDDKEGCIIGKLVYIYEGKEDVCKGKRRLTGAVYLGGRYAGSDGNRKLWERVDEYIRKTYDTEAIKRIYILGDGASWIKAGADYIFKGRFVADKYHLMKYINAAARQMLDDEEEIKEAFYRHIYKGRKQRAQKLIERMKKSAENIKPIEALESFLMNNWEAIRWAYKDKHVYGCSAEGHVSHIYADRMSSRPMGWSETGADRMCRLRCLIKSEGEGKIIELVEARRRRIYEELAATGTEGIRVETTTVRRKLTQAQKESAYYAERLHARFNNTLTRKKIAIKLHISDL